MATVSEALHIAVGLHRRQDFAQAAKIYQDIIAAAPMVADAWHLLGLLLHQTGQHADGIACIQAAIQRDRCCANYYDSLGSAYRALPDTALAAASHRLAIALEPDNRKPYANLGNALRDHGVMEAAERAYRRAARLDPTHGAALIPLAACLTALGRGGEAARVHRIGVALTPDLSLALDAWAKACLADGGAPDVAERLCERLNAADPGNPERIHNLGLAKLTASTLLTAHLSEAARLVDCGKIRAALDLFKTAGLRHGHGNALRNYFGTALLAIQSGVIDEPVLDSVVVTALPHLAANPGDINAVAVVCYALYRRGKLAVASRFFRKFSRHPSSTGEADAFERFWTMVQGEPRFFATLAAYEPRLLQRRMHHVLAPPRPDAGPIILAGCDEGYWRRFGVAFLASWEERAPSCALHVHLINPSGETRAELERLHAARPAKLSASCEIFDDAGLSNHQRVTYYTCARFAVAERLLREAGVPVVQVDIDATFDADPGAAMAAWPGWDISIMRDKRGRGPMRDFLAGFMAFNATEGGHGFLDLVLRYIGWHFDRGLVFWGLDQAAPYCVFDHLKGTGRAPATVWHDFERFPFLHFLKK
ncbi:tetratricopeptide repeat protein [Azospirillum doebereinerae]|uniref:tetratricopeptide repeat protein n=1 Tax=Azospirillum doebereinerae TaxID=92933 RepID=UPI00384C289A